MYNLINVRWKMDRLDHESMAVDCVNVECPIFVEENDLIEAVARDDVEDLLSDEGECLVVDYEITKHKSIEGFQDKRFKLSFWDLLREMFYAELGHTEQLKLTKEAENGTKEFVKNHFLSVCEPIND